MRVSPYQTFPDRSQASIPERLEYIQTGVIIETEARLGFKKFLANLTRNPLPSSERLVFMTAPSGMGLSEMMREFTAQHPPLTENNTGRIIVPVIREHVHPSGDIVDLCDDIRAELAIPGYINMQRHNSFPQTLKLIGGLGTQLVILEDFHRTHSFVKSQTTVYQGFVHHLISRFDIRVVLTGAPKIWRWAMEDEQTLGRAVHLQYLEWTPGDEDFIEFLEGFERWCPIQQGSTLSKDTKLRKAVIRKTRGIARNVMRELTEFAVYSILSGSEKLDLDTWLEYRDRDVQ